MTERRRIVIVGAGFGGLATAKGLAGTSLDVTLIDRLSIGAQTGTGIGVQ